MEQNTIWESITLLVAFESLHNDLEMKTASLLHFGDKDLEKIQQIVTSTEAVNFAKYTVKTTVVLALIAKKKQLEIVEMESKPGEECFS